MNKVVLEKHGGYAILTLNRADAMNALSRELREDFVAAFENCSEDESIRVVIITGAGKAFCAGFDLKELAESAANPDEEADNVMARAMEAFDGPIIGAVNGHAITGGFELALACDVLIASEDARFADTHARVGILPGWGLSQKLPRLIGLSRAKELSFTGAPLVARQAYEWGLVNHVVAAAELLDRAREMAENMCACVPEVLKQYKSLIDEGYNKPWREALAWEEEQAIESARHIMAATIAGRRDAIMEKGRSEKSDG
jgi:enoyl-CoA hydratase